MTVLRHVLWKLKCLVCAPYLLFRQRTGVQLMVSHVAVVLLTFVLINVLAVLVVVGWLPGRSLVGLETATQDFFLGERTQSHALWVDTERIRAEHGSLGSPGARAELDRLLTMIVSGDVPGFSPGEEARVDSNGLVTFGVPKAALITDTRGVVLASTDPSLGEPGDRAWEIGAPAVSDAITATVRNGGAVDDRSGVAYTVRVNDDVTGAAAPIFGPDGEVDAYLAFQGYPLPEIYGQARSELLRETALSVLRASWIYTIPAVLVALPFAYWRARTTSRRLERLANLADAFADGDLHTRIKVTRHDEIGRLAERFNEMGIRIEEDARVRRAFLSNVSHELRTPVSIIQGTVERLEDKRCATAEEAEQAIALVNLETLNLTRLIDDLSTLGRLEEAKLRLELQPVDAHAVADGAAKGLKQMAWTQRKVSIENIVPRDLPLAFADPGRLRQIVHNLLFNALRHTPEGGLIVVQGAVAGDRMEISVSDTGVGIPPDRLEKIFTRYYQAEMSQRSGEGSGLGLHIVRQLVEAQGGTIAAESTVGTGTTVRFTLPLSSQHRTRDGASRRDGEEVV